MFFRALGSKGRDGTLVFLNATGLNASAYLPLLEQLSFDGLILAGSLRGHGATDLPANPKELQSWELFAEDVATELEKRGVDGPLTLAGHSAGSVTALLTAKRLSTQQVIMIEPVVLPAFAVWLANTPLKAWTIDQNPLARRAAARRSHFPSREEAAAAYRRKGFFKSWDEEAFAGYIEEGFREAGEAGGVVLSCDPAWEAACFGAQASGFWPHLDTVISRGTQVDILGAEVASTFTTTDRQRARDKGASVLDMDGSHMLPVEEPARVASWMSDRLSTIEALGV